MKVYIETYGCTMNQGDSDIIRAYLSREHELVDSADKSDVVVINSCGVIGFTERKIAKRIKRLKELGKKVVVTGCLTKINPKIISHADALLSPKKLENVNLAIAKIASGERFVDLSNGRVDKSSLPKKRLRINAIAIVPISEGCLGKCSYCATKFARGSLKSFSLEKIVKEVENCVKEGYREIQLTAQDTGAYGKDLGLSLVDLLEKIVEIDGEFRVRVGMMNPHHALEMLDELLDVFSSEKIYKFLHIPVQSGDNEILRHMRRDHTVEDFLEVVKAFRKRFEVTIATDIIVGYPTESEESFERTYKLIETVKPDIVNITRFSPRPNTLASKLKDMPEWIKKERSRKLTKLMERIGMEINRKYFGRKLRVLITKHGKNDTLVARSDNYKPVVVRSGDIGEFAEVRIVGYTSTYLVGCEDEHY